MIGDLLAAGTVARAQRARRVFARLGDKAQDRLVTLLTLVLRVVTLAAAHLIAEKRMHRGVGVHRDFVQLHVGRSPDPFPQAPLDSQQLSRHAQMQRGQKSPEGALRRKFGHAQNAGQHRFALQKAQMVQTREPYVAGQHHPQNKPEHRHRAGLPLGRQRFFDQLLEPKFLQHRGHREQTSVGCQIPRFEVIGRGSPDFIRLWNIPVNPLIHGPPAFTLVCIRHHLGELLRIGSRSSQLRVPTVLKQDSQGFPNGPVHYSGDIELPANPIRGTRLVWKVPTQALVREILVNPFYAGAYVWGRRPMETVLVDGHLKKRQTSLRPAENCRVFIRDHHEGYIDWAIYEENQRVLRRNSVNWQRDESMAAIRAGQGLLVGLLRCGHCGRKLHVRYWGARGTHARYLCKGEFADGGRYCIGFGSASVDRRLSKEVLQVISPLGVEASLKALEELSARDAAQRAALSSKLEQLEYEAKKAFEQYDAVDARNRLVASELERRWNEKLEEV